MDTYFAVLPLLGADASQVEPPMKMVLVSTTPVGFQKSWSSFARKGRAAELQIDY